MRLMSAARRLACPLVRDCQFLSPFDTSERFCRFGFQCIEKIVEVLHSGNPQFTRGFEQSICVRLCA